MLLSFLPEIICSCDFFSRRVFEFLALFLFYLKYFFFLFSFLEFFFFLNKCAEQFTNRKFLCFRYDLYVFILTSMCVTYRNFRWSQRTRTNKRKKRVMKITFILWTERMKRVFCRMFCACYRWLHSFILS